MTFLKGKKQKVVFKRRAMAASNTSRRFEELSSSDQRDNPAARLAAERTSGYEAAELLFRTSGVSAMAASVRPASLVPELFTSYPQIRDLLNTGTSNLQEQTIQECLPFLSGLEPGALYNEHGVPHLDRKRHIQFLHKTLGKLPAPYVAADASRPWMFYWVLAGLSAMGEDISQYRERLISTVRPIQNITGGFGGGNGQMSHLAPTYAILLSLAMVGGTEAFEIIDRRAMWRWLGALKQPDGAFQMAIGGEADVR